LIRLTKNNTGGRRKGGDTKDGNVAESSPAWGRVRTISEASEKKTYKETRGTARSNNAG
jgi:hypothetical protein